jgi:hypothetical protein
LRGIPAVPAKDNSQVPASDQTVSGLALTVSLSENLQNQGYSQFFTGFYPLLQVTKTNNSVLNPVPLILYLSNLLRLIFFLTFF